MNSFESTKADAEARNRFLELRLAGLLQIGVLLSGAMILTGWFLSDNFLQTDFKNFSKYESRPLVEALIELADAGDFAGLMSYAGLFFLVALPMARVAFSVASFLCNRDRIMATAATMVLIGLAIGFLLGNLVGS